MSADGDEYEMTSTGRFQKGQTGNPNGRPKNHVSLPRHLTKALQRRVIVEVDGHATSMTALEAIVARWTQAALSGDTDALKLLLLMKAHRDLQANPPTVQVAVSSYDEPPPQRY